MNDYYPALDLLLRTGGLAIVAKGVAELARLRSAVKQSSAASPRVMTEPLASRPDNQTADVQEPALLSDSQAMAALGEQTPGSVRRYVFDSLLLADSFRHLLAGCTAPGGRGFHEAFHYCCGPQLADGRYVITRIVPVRYASCSAAHLRVDDTSNIHVLDQLDRFGLPLLAHLHTHPGSGPEANRPSSVDRRFQDRLDRGGHIAIGGVYSKDGILRFYANVKFEVEVIGNGITRLEEHVYQLDLGGGEIPLPRLKRFDSSDVTDRQDRLPCFSSAALAQMHVLLIGAGGLGGAIADALVRKGVGQLSIADGDVAEPSNLNRQPYLVSDLFRPKAIALAHHAAQHGCLGASVTGHYVNFVEDTAMRLAKGVTAAVCGVDNDRTRAVASRFLRTHRVPVVFLACSKEADYGWAFVQEAHGPCVGCVFPQIAAAEAERKPCPAAPATIDILRVLGGIALYALDTLEMARPRYWNFRSVHLAGGSPDCVTTVARRPGCRLCGPQGR